MRSFFRHPKYYKNFFKVFWPSIRMSGKNINFGDKKITKVDFIKTKKNFKIYDIDANKILLSKKEPYGTNKSFKFFIGYNDNDDIRPL